MHSNTHKKKSWEKNAILSTQMSGNHDFKHTVLLLAVVVLGILRRQVWEAAVWLELAGVEVIYFNNAIL